MDPAFETRTLELTFDLLTDRIPTAADILWTDVLISKKFHNEITQKIIGALKEEFGLISQDFYNGNQKSIKSIISKSAGEYAENTLAVKKIEDLKL